MTSGKENSIREKEWKKSDRCSHPKGTSNLEKYYQDDPESRKESLGITEGSSHHLRKQGLVIRSKKTGT